MFLLIVTLLEKNETQLQVANKNLLFRIELFVLLKKICVQNVQKY